MENSNSAPPDRVTLANMIACETAVWEALIRGDKDADLASLHRDFLGVYPSGFATRADHASQLDAGPSVVSYDIRQAQLLTLAPGCYCLSYLACFRRPNRFEGEEMYVSSIWQWQAGQWVNVFSQDTPRQSP